MWHSVAMTARVRRNVAPARLGRRPGPPDQSPSSSTPLPPDILMDAARRVGVVALLYACVFAVVGPVTALMSPDQRQAFFTSALRWGPSAASIAAALVVAASSRRGRLAPTSV